MVKKKSYLELKADLTSVLDELQQQDTDVDKALELHKKGQELLKKLEDYLADVEDGIKLKSETKKG